MPFTLVHPVAVLPLARGPLSLAALVSGAVAPDLPYYLRATGLPVTAQSWYEPYLNATAAHSLAGLIPVALPWALVGYAGWLAASPPARWLTGLPFRADSRIGAARLGWIVVSLLLGVLTHLAWDALTELGPAGSRVLQHASTVLGAALLAVVLWRHRARIDLREAPVRRRVCVALLTGALIVAVAGAFALGSWLPVPAELATRQVVEGILADAAKSSISALLAGLAVFVSGWWLGRWVWPRPGVVGDR